MLSSPILSRLGEDASLLAPGSIVLPPEGEHARPRQHRRQLLAILAVDVVGYSQMVEADDLRTALRVRSLRRRLLEPAARRHAGWVFSVAGDGAMAAFPAAAAAVDCAVAVQRALDLLERAEPAASRLRLRMGICYGSVLQVDGELYGRPLNVAARLEALAEPGGIYVSGAVFDRVGGLGPARFEPLGERLLAKISTPRRVYRVDRGSCPGGPL